MVVVEVVAGVVGGDPVNTFCALCKLLQFRKRQILEEVQAIFDILSLDLCKSSFGSKCYFKNLKIQ